MKPLVSIIVPIYNVEAYLARCIDSIIFQTYDNLEIILVDDESPDNCGIICDEYSAKDSRICVIHKKNAGVGYARNSGLEKCTGDFIMFVDPDDYLREDCVEILYNRIISDESDIAISNYAKVYDDGQNKRGNCKCFEETVVSRNRVLGEFSLHCVYVTVWGKLYRRRIIANISFPQLCCGEDTWVFGDIMAKCNTISFVNEPLYNYYQRANSIVHSRVARKQLDSINSDLRLAKYLLQEGFFNNSAAVFSSCVDRALSIEKIHDRLKYFKLYFDKKSRKSLLKITDFETKIKWCGLFLPYSNRIRSIIVNLKKK